MNNMPPEARMAAIAHAAHAVHSAQQALLENLEKQLPAGTRAKATVGRSQFVCEVIRHHKTDPGLIHVFNVKTGNQRKINWYQIDEIIEVKP